MAPTQAPAGARKPAFGRVLTIGSKGADVSAVKLALHAWNPLAMTNTTDFFGKGMNDALKKFQREQRIQGDGVYGPTTHAKLRPYFSKEAAALYELASPKLVQPIPKACFQRIGPIHETAGLPGYPALDFFANTGSPVLAPEDGVAVRFSGHNPAGGPISGIHGPFGWSIYFEGKSGTEYYLTHLGTRLCTIGHPVHCATRIATVGDYARWGGANHTHVGVHGGSVTIEKLGKAALAA